MSFDFGNKSVRKRKVEMNSYIDEIIKNSFDKYFEDLDFITNNTIEFIQRNILFYIKRFQYWIWLNA